MSESRFHTLIYIPKRATTDGWEAELNLLVSSVLKNGHYAVQGCPLLFGALHIGHTNNKAHNFITHAKTASIDSTRKNDVMCLVHTLKKKQKNTSE